MDKEMTLFCVGVGVVFATVNTWANSPEGESKLYCSWWPFATFLVFILSKILELLAKKFYCLVVMILAPVNFAFLWYGAWIFLHYFPDVYQHIIVFTFILILQVFQSISYVLILLLCIWTCKWDGGFSLSSVLSQTLINDESLEIELEKIIETKPVSDSFHNEETCTICLLSFTKDDVISELKECNHIFHQSCIKQWIAVEARCPNCNLCLANNKER
ncbi:unnamed protein product [Moneuplotes crassus]|uniref:RING-type domain-containing protein n=1 Tax=Euplotes crassus TaxID=5936 RepID=A0AAD1XU62_EUPCR|nr:unnamed protein product [Moneuplotes crassus]